MTHPRIYYNENDTNAAAWLAELMKVDAIPPGVIDTRSIVDVSPADVKDFTQCHWFAGIAGWAYALRLAGWPDDRPVWTGSCPCQPFSVAGKQKGFHDDRHLWPHWFWLIDQCRPATVFGEQVASALAWFDLVSTDLERSGYAVGAADLCAAGVGAPHLRQRLWFVAHDTRDGWREERAVDRGESGGDCPEGVAAGLVSSGADHRIVGHATSEQHDGSRDTGAKRRDEYPDASGARLVADPDGRQSGDGDLQRSGGHGQQSEDEGADRGGSVADTECRPTERHRHELADAAREMQGETAERERIRFDIGHGRESFWSPCDWLPCRDGKARPVEPSTFPLAHGLSARVGRLRGYGNAVVPQVAEVFIRAYLDV